MKIFCHRMGSDFLVLCFAALSALVVGCVINLLRSAPLPWIYVSPEERLREVVAGLQEGMAGGTDVVRVRLASFEEMAEIVDSGTGMVLDARPEVFFELEHIPSAVSFPKEEFEERYLLLKEELMWDTGRVKVVYCGDESCDDSLHVAEALAELGVRPVLVFKSGLKGWKEKGMPTEAVQ